jgi:hypothetical protein
MQVATKLILMSRFETSPRRDNRENKPRTGLFQRVWSRSPETQQKQEKSAVKPKRKLTEILKHASTPRERELANQNREVKKETRGLLSQLREDVEPTKRHQINELRKMVTRNPDISKNQEAIRAYQELIKLTYPERFAREIKKVDGIYSSGTRKAYETDKKGLDTPRTAVLSALSSNTPKETPEARTQTMRKESEWFSNFLNFNNGGSDGIGGKINSLPKQYSSRGTTLCSQTARLNLNRLWISVPSGDADSVFGQYRGGGGGGGMLKFDSGGFNPPAGATVADIMLDTPQLPSYSRDYGHRFAAYKEGGTWYALDPYYGGTTSPIPLNSFLSRFRGRQGYSVRGAAFYAA